MKKRRKRSGRGSGGPVPPVEKRFKPGQSGCPGGRPPGIPDRRRISKNLRDMLSMVDIADVDLAERLKSKLADDKEDTRLLRWVLEMLHGKPKQALDLQLGVGGEVRTAIEMGATLRRLVESGGLTEAQYEQAIAMLDAPEPPAQEDGT